jgi:hypothetical protein
MTRERLGPTLVVGDLEITPVERISIRHRRFEGTHLFEGEKRPVAVLVRSAEGERRIELGEPGSGEPPPGSG